jgi:PAS domain S-box-containing protein
MVEFAAELITGDGSACEGAVGFVSKASDERAPEGRDRLVWETEQTLQMVFANSGDAIVVADGNGRIVIANEALCKMLGYSRKELIGSHIIGLSPQQGTFDTFTGEQVTLTEDYINYQYECATELFEKGKLTYELYYIRKDGKIIPVETTISLLTTPDGDFKGSITICRDITKRKLAEQERDRLATAVTQADESVVITDRNARIIYCNPALERLTGYGCGELLGSSIDMLLKQYLDRGHFNKIIEQLNSGETWKGHIIIKAREGTAYDQHATISPMKSEQGHLTHFIFVMHDMTEQLKLEKKLRQVHKMEAIGTLAGGIAHEFNNIIGAIMGYTDMALAELDEQSEPYDHLQQVITAADRAKHIVKQVIAFSRTAKNQPQMVHLKTMVDEAVRTSRASLPSSIKIIAQAETDKDIIAADPIQIHQAIRNLCANAVESINDKCGSVELVLRERSINGGQEYDLAPGDFLELRIADTGCGMDAETMERMFDPFFSTKGPAVAAGMGLSVAYGIIKSHGGTILAESTPGAGSTFRVLLPRA